MEGEDDVVKRMQILQPKISQNERELKTKTIEKSKKGKKIRIIQKEMQELDDKKREIWREKRKLEEQLGKIKWRLEEIKKLEPRIVPEIDKKGKELQKLNNEARWDEVDFLKLQSDKRKLEREYRQLRKKRQEMERKGL